MDGPGTGFEDLQITPPPTHTLATRHVVGPGLVRTREQPRLSEIRGTVLQR
jgi:hypothetical protein